MRFRSYPRLYFELILIGFAIMVGMSLSSSFLPIFAKDLDPSGFLVGFVTSAWFSTRIFFELPAGIISDRIGRRKLFIIGVGLSALGAFFCTQALNIFLLIIGRAIWGLGAGLFFTNSTALVIDLFQFQERGQALGIFNGVEFIGSFIGAPIGAVIVGLVESYNGVFYVTLVLLLISFFSSLTSKSFTVVRSVQVIATNVSVKQSVESLRHRGIVIFCICNLLNSLVMGGIFATVLVLYLNKELFFSLEIIGLFLSVRTAGLIVATLGSGSFADRISRRRVIIIGFFLASSCLVLFTMVQTVELLFVVGFMSGCGEGLIAASLIVLLSNETPPSARGGAIGFFRTFMDVGGFIGPVAFMAVYTLVNSRAAFLMAFGIIVLSMTLIISWLYRKKIARADAQV